MSDVFFKIVIPNYNNAQYLKQCLDSILQQTFQDYFIVVVDDMSTDKSLDILKQYESSNSDKLKVLSVDKKSYQGICRNIGLEFPISSEYVWFIDSDDYIYDKTCLQRLHDYALQYNADMLYFDYFTDNGTIQLNTTPELVRNIQTGMLLFNGIVAPWARIYRTSSLNIRFTQFLFEDMLFFIQYVNDNHSIAKINDAVYVYRKHDTSDTAQFERSNKSKNVRYLEYLQQLKKLETQLKNCDLKQCINLRLKFDNYIH